MIQLANDPNADRTGYRPASGEEEARGQAFGSQRARTGHAWPFLSRQAVRPARQDSPKPASEQHGS